MSIIDRKRHNHKDNNSCGCSTNSSKPKNHEEIAKEFYPQSGNGKQVKSIMEFAKEFVPNLIPKTVKNKLSGLNNSANANSMPKVSIEEIAKEFFNNPSYKPNSTNSSAGKNTNAVTEIANEFLSANTKANKNLSQSNNTNNNPLSSTVSNAANAVTEFANEFLDNTTKNKQSTNISTSDIAKSVQRNANKSKPIEEIANDFLPTNNKANLTNKTTSTAQNSKLKTQQEIAKEFMPKHDNGATIQKKK